MARRSVMRSAYNIGKILGLSSILAVLLDAYRIRNRPNIDFSLETHNKHALEPTNPVTQKERGTKYAILITGDRDIGPGKIQTAQDAQELVFFINTAFAYQALERRGVERKNMHLFSSSGTTSPMIEGPTRVENILKSLRHMAKKSKPGDTLLIQYSGHGDLEKETKRPYMHLPTPSSPLSQRLYVEDLTDIIKDSQFDYVVAMFGCCYGGNMAKRAGRNNIIGISPSAEGKLGYSRLTLEQINTTFITNFLNADRNQDGRVTLEEMFDHGVEQSPFTAKERIKRDFKKRNIMGKFFLHHYFQEGERPQLIYQNANPSELSLPEERRKGMLKKAYGWVRNKFR